MLLSKYVDMWIIIFCLQKLSTQFNIQINKTLNAKKAEQVKSVGSTSYSAVIVKAPRYNFFST